MRRNLISISAAALSLLFALACNSATATDDTPLSTEDTSPVSVVPTLPPESTTPVVLFLVDQSRSMNDDFGGMSRWEAVQQVFSVDEDGAVADLAERARIGITMYSGEADDGGCPLIAGTSPVTNNRDSLDMLVKDAVPVSESPTDEGILAAAQTLASYRGERWIVLLTDGAPTSCDGTDVATAHDAAVGAAAAAFAQRVRLAPIGLGDGVPERFLQEVAKAGAGVAVGDDVEMNVGTARNLEELRQALDEFADRVGE